MSDQKKTPSQRGGGWMRLKGMIRKEFLQIVRDPSSIAIAFVLPLLLLLIFGYGVSLDAQNVPMALVVDNPSAETAGFVGSFEQSSYFEPHMFTSIQTAEAALRQGMVDGIIWLRGDFAEAVLSGGSASIGVFINGVDANTARIVKGYVQGAWQRWLVHAAVDRGERLHIPVSVEQRIWFNPGLRSRNFLVPGLIAIIMTLIGALLTALVVAREWERGTMEALMVTPIRVREFLMGKIVPYFVLGLGGLLLSVAMTVWLFEVPLRGNLIVLLGVSALFLLAALGMGLLISTLAKNQFVAGQTAILVTFLPAFILSGFIFDINSMPLPIQAVTHLIAARYYVAVLQTVFAAGNVWSVVWPNTLALALMAAVFLLLVNYHTRKRLE